MPSAAQPQPRAPAGRTRPCVPQADRRGQRDGRQGDPIEALRADVLRAPAIRRPRRRRPTCPAGRRRVGPPRGPPARHDRPSGRAGTPSRWATSQQRPDHRADGQREHVGLDQPGDGAKVPVENVDVGRGPRPPEDRAGHVQQQAGEVDIGRPPQPEGHHSGGRGRRPGSPDRPPGAKRIVKRVNDGQRHGQAADPRYPTLDQAAREEEAGLGPRAFRPPRARAARAASFSASMARPSKTSAAAAQAAVKTW